MLVWLYVDCYTKSSILIGSSKLMMQRCLLQQKRKGLLLGELIYLMIWFLTRKNLMMLLRRWSCGLNFQVTSLSVIAIYFKMELMWLKFHITLFFLNFVGCLLMCFYFGRRIREERKRRMKESVNIMLNGMMRYKDLIILQLVIYRLIVSI